MIKDEKNQIIKPNNAFKHSDTPAYISIILSFVFGVKVTVSYESHNLIILLLN